MREQQKGRKNTRGKKEEEKYCALSRPTLSGAFSSLFCYLLCFVVFFFFFFIPLFFPLSLREMLVFSSRTKMLLKMVICHSHDHFSSTLTSKMDRRGKMKCGRWFRGLIGTILARGHFGTLVIIYGAYA